MTKTPSRPQRFVKTIRSVVTDLLTPPLITREDNLRRERIKSVFSKPTRAPVIIFGVQKSGTSAISGLLGEATALRTQIDFQGAWEPFMTDLVLGRTEIADFVNKNAWAFSAKIIKEPCLTFVAPQVMAHFPNGQAVFVVREPARNIQSILNRLRLSGQDTTLDANQGAALNDTWRSILTGQDMGLQGLNTIEVLARRWQRAAEIYYADSDQYILVRYEDFLAGKVTEIGHLAKSLNIPVKHDIHHLVDVAFQPAARNRVGPLAFFGQKNLSLIHEICGPAAAKLGYAERMDQDLGT
ncbi:MAG: hypothetical protein WBC93_09310 [Sulfitobacter sp.]